MFRAELIFRKKAQIFMNLLDAFIFPQHILFNNICEVYSESLVSSKSLNTVDNMNGSTLTPFENRTRAVSKELRLGGVRKSYMPSGSCDF